MRTVPSSSVTCAAHPRPITPPAGDSVLLSSLFTWQSFLCAVSSTYAHQRICSTVINTYGQPSTALRVHPAQTNYPVITVDRTIIMAVLDSESAEISWLSMSNRSWNKGLLIVRNLSVSSNGIKLGSEGCGMPKAAQVNKEV